MHRKVRASGAATVAALANATAWVGLSVLTRGRMIENGGCKRVDRSCQIEEERHVSAGA
jgi:hypothetical protein